MSSYRHMMANICCLSVLVTHNISAFGCQMPCWVQPRHVSDGLCLEQVTQESKEAEDIQAVVAQEEQTVARQTAETMSLKGVLGLPLVNWALLVLLLLAV